MSVRALHAELAAVRALVSDGLAEVRAGSDPGQFWVRSACARLVEVDDALVQAAGVLPHRFGWASRRWSPSPR